MTRRSRIARTLAPMLALAAVALLPSGAWALTATLAIPTLCADPIPVVAFATEAGNTGFSDPGGGGSTGKPTIKPLTLTKAVDDCSALLFRAAFTGQRHPTATVQVTGRTAAGTFTIRLTDVLIVNVKTEFAKGATQSEDTLTEAVTLDAAAFAFTSGGTTVSCNGSTVTCQ